MIFKFNDFEIDSFMINLDIANHDLTYSTMFYCNIFFQNTRGKVYLILFKYINIEMVMQNIKNMFDELKLEEISSKLVIVNDLPKNISQVASFMSELNTEDSVIVVGGERLVPYGEIRPKIKTEIFEKTAQIHLQVDENWNEFSVRIDKLYEEIQKNISGLVLNCSVDNCTRTLILKQFEKSNNMSISSNEMINKTDDGEMRQREILETISKISLSDSLELIDKNRENLNDSICSSFKAIAFLASGDIDTAIDLLKKQYNKLLVEEKLLLSDLLVISDNHKEAKKIVSEIFEQDKYENGLMPAILRAFEEDEISVYKKWLDIALNIDPTNPTVIECYGDWLVENKKYDLAAKQFRTLNNIMHKPYYELIARINDLLAVNMEDLKLVKEYLFYVLDENPELKNEVVYRMASFYFYREKFFPAYTIIKEADILVGALRIAEIEKIKIDILSDTEKASKALFKIKPFYKDGDAQRLSSERSKALIEFIQIYHMEKNGFYEWRHFIECQTENVWSQNLYFELIKILKNIISVDFETKIKESYISDLEICGVSDVVNCSSGIILLRRLRTGEFQLEESNSSLDEIIKGSIILAEKEGSVQEKVWTRYYASIISSLLIGNPQDANNYALTLFDYQFCINKENKKMCAYLGLLAWGNSQYRLGRQVEGIACIISSFQFAIELNEVYPFLEEGVNIIVRFLSDNNKLIRDADKNLINSFIDKVTQYNDSVKPLYCFINESYEDEIAKLKISIEKSEKRDANWAGKIVNLVQAYVQSNMIEESVKLIILYHEEVVKYLEYRKDIRYKILYSWADIMFKGGRTLDSYLFAIELLKQSMQDIEEKREAYHQEERAAVSVFADKVYRKYMMINTLLYAARDIDLEIMNKIQDNILKVANKFSPSSIIEQKQYNNYKEITPKLEKLHLELQRSKEKYNTMALKNGSNDDNVLLLAKRMSEIMEELKKNHPYYMPLGKYCEIDWLKIREIMDDKDVLYQFIVTKITVTTIIVDKKDIKLNVHIIDQEYNDVYDVIKKFAEQIQLDWNNDKECLKISEIFSQLIAEDLFKYITINSIKTLYVIPDFKINLFPIAACNYKGEYLIDKVKSIINLIDYNAIIQKQAKQSVKPKVLNRVYGNIQDKSIGLITQWLNTKVREEFKIMENMDDSIGNIQNIINENGINTLAIYAHGAKDPGSVLIEGAQTIVGKKSMIKISDILKETNNIDTFILISCIGGTPNSVNPEVSTGTWAHMFEKMMGNILACKWSVPTKETVELVDKLFDLILQDNEDLGSALIIAQRAMREKGNGILYWAGIEYWIN